MKIKCIARKRRGLHLELTALAAILLAGCGSDGAAVSADPQTISFSDAPTLTLGGTGTVSATASSNLAVSYSSTTPSVCSVNGSTGLVTDISAGTCIIAANQAGSAGFAPAAQETQSIDVTYNPGQSIVFGAAPALSWGGTASVTATASSGLAVLYSSTTPAICSVDGSSGLVTDIALGDCTIAANQAGNSQYSAAPPTTQTIAVSTPSGPITVPGAPTEVAAAAGNAIDTVAVSIGPTSSGGSPITGYTVISSPSGISATGVASPITVSCPSTCSGYAFSVIATNSIGNSVPSTSVDVLTNYNVVETFYEPMTQPDNTIFTGSFTYDATTKSITGLQGALTESMTGTPTATVALAYQLSTSSDGLGGALVTTFALNTSDTFYQGGFAPGSGSGLYFGYPSAKNPASGGTGNAYAMIDVNLSNPTAAPTSAQLNLLAYADCTKLGMMGATCMTGTSLAGYGTVGTMSGYPLSQTITKR